LFIGSLDNIKAFEQWLKPQLNDSQYWYDAKTAQSRLSNTLGTAEKFLSLASMLGIVLAAVAVSVASRRYGQRHQPMVAVFKALGASLSHIKKLYYLHWSLLSLLSILIGLVIGYLLLLLGNQAIEQYLSLENIAIGSGPFIVAILTGIICAFSFALHPLHQLISTSPLAVIRGFSLDKSKHFGWHQFPPLLALFVLLMVFSRDLTMSLSLLIAGSLVAGVLLFFGRMLMSAGRVVGSKAGKSWHLALANLKRRASENSVQLVSFTIAIQLLLLIVVVKNSILEQWQAQLPKDTPNHYVVNIAKQQLLPLEMFVQKSAIKTKGFYPVVRGRLSLINNEKVQDLKNVIQAEKNQQKKDGNENQEQRRQGVGRELGLTWRQDLPFDNTLLEGLWWQKGDELKQVSIEGRMADKLAIKLGDRLTFDIGGELITAPVTNIRKVNWQNRQLNFIMIFNPAALKHFSTTYVSAWMVPADEKQAISGFLKDYPTITVMDFGAILKQLHKVIEQVSIAIELILILVILAGSLVLVAQVQASMEERERELAILRTLGAKGSLLRNSVLFEFVALGAIAGFMASLAMEVAVYMLQTRIFDMSPSFHFSYWLLGIGAGGAFVGLIGLISCWRLLNLSSITLIRRTM
jgi:putative ABC transport system permease protein